MRLRFSILALASLLFAPTKPAASGDAAAEPSKLKPFGDFRLRHESDVSREGQVDRHRERVRVRIGASYDLSEDFSVVGELRTGDPGSPRSPHQTLGNNFDSFSVSFDQAYVRWHPDAWKGFAATAGKFPQPFSTNPVFAETQWDADLRPEGLALAYSGELCAGSSVTLTLARYILLERAGDDVGVWAGQVAFKTTSGKAADWTLALDFHRIGDTEPGGTTNVVARNAGNLVVDLDEDGQADAFASEFTLFHPLASVRLNQLGLGQPLTLAAELVHNRRAVNHDDTAFTLGASLGQNKKKGDWLIYWQYLKVEQESVFSAFAQDDFPRSTNFRGQLVGMRYMVHDKANLNLWALTSRSLAAGAPDWDWRLRADLNLWL